MIPKNNEIRQFMCDNKPDFKCANRAKHSAALNLPSSVCDFLRMSIRIPQPMAVFID